ncbi:hypothetical protein FQR65_LT16258 [Abscondita terminalis]|nr:hypothetical protein FQR65_LT16258 [Abscondita terminalis]
MQLRSICSGIWNRNISLGLTVNPNMGLFGLMKTAMWMENPKPDFLMDLLRISAFARNYYFSTGLPDNNYQRPVGIPAEFIFSKTRMSVYNMAEIPLTLKMKTSDHLNSRRFLRAIWFYYRSFNFMKIALAQLNYHIGNFEKNNSAIIHTIARAKEQQADLIIFAELAIGGYPAKDLLRNAVFIQNCADAIELIASHCHDIACIIGAPVRNTDPEGKSLYNGAVFIADGKVSHISKKGLLPDYDVFDEYRYFEPSRHFNCFKFKGETIALTVCEDLWDDDSSNSYVGDPMEELLRENPNLIVNIAASPFSYTHFENRLTVLRKQVVTFENGDLASANSSITSGHTEIALIHEALILGLRDYFLKSGFKKATLGLSGGLDSAVVAALACEAIGAENVLAYTDCHPYSSDIRSKMLWIL